MILFLKYFFSHFFLHFQTTHKYFWCWDNIEQYFKYDFVIYHIIEERSLHWFYINIRQLISTQKLNRFYKYFALYIFEYQQKLFLIALYKKAPLTHYINLDKVHLIRKKKRKKKKTLFLSKTFKDVSHVTHESIKAIMTKSKPSRKRLNFLFL